MNHADRRQIILHEIRGAQVQNVQSADRVQFLLRRMQPRDWPGAFRNLRGVAAQVHRVAQAGLFHGFRDRIAIPLLLLRGFRRRQHQIKQSVFMYVYFVQVGLAWTQPPAAPGDGLAVTHALGLQAGRVDSLGEREELGVRGIGAGKESPTRPRSATGVTAPVASRKTSRASESRSVPRICRSLAVVCASCAPVAARSAAARSARRSASAELRDTGLHRRRLVAQVAHRRAFGGALHEEVGDATGDREHDDRDQHEAAEEAGAQRRRAGGSRRCRSDRAGSRGRARS